MTTYNLASQANLDIANGKIAALTTALANLATRVGLDEGEIATLMAAVLPVVPPGVPPVIPPVVPPVVGALWPNLPAHLLTVHDYSLQDPIPAGTGDRAWSQGWGIVRGNAKLVSDPTAPLGDPTLQIDYPVGFPSGSEPVTIYRPASGDEGYVACWWKISSPWQGDPSGINKLWFWQLQNNANLILMANNQQQSGYLLTFTLEQLTAINDHLPNIAGFPGGTVWHLFGNRYPLVPGNWYRVESYFKRSTTPTSRDGIVRVWATKLGDLTPTLVSEYLNVNTDASGLAQAEIAPTWGGNSGIGKSEADWYRLNRVVVATP